MSKTIYYVASSADGYIADRENRIDWLLAFGFETFNAHYQRFLAGIGAVVMGASTYEFLLAEDEGWAYDLPAWVFTHRELAPIARADIRFTAASVTEVHEAAMEAAGGRDVWMIGGGDIAAQFADAGLLDEFHVTVMPVLLGAGRPVLPVSSAPVPLTLLETTPFEGGAIELRYTVGKR